MVVPVLVGAGPSTPLVKSWALRLHSEKSKPAPSAGATAAAIEDGAQPVTQLTLWARLKGVEASSASLQHVERRRPRRTSSRTQCEPRTPHQTGLVVWRVAVLLETLWSSSAPRPRERCSSPFAREQRTAPSAEVSLIAARVLLATHAYECVLIDR